MVEMVLDNKVRYKEPGESLPTFREEIDRYAGICPWLIFGIDLALGSGLDRPMTYREQMFGPEILEKAFSEAVVQMSPDSAAVPLVSRTEVLYDPEVPACPPETPFYLTPLSSHGCFSSLSRLCRYMIFPEKGIPGYSIQSCFRFTDWAA